MPWSYHSHSGQFCAHGRGKLEDCLQAAINVR
jgi:histidinol phosphatase-like PHP family hydrolase